MTVTLFCDESHCPLNLDKTNRQSEEKYFCIAGIVVPEVQEAAFVEKINALKRRHFRRSRRPEKVEIKGFDCVNKKDGFTSFTDEAVTAFRRELSHLIFYELGVKVIRECKLESDAKALIGKKLQGGVDLGPYELTTLFLVKQYNSYLNRKDTRGRIIFDKGNCNARKVVSWLKKYEHTMVWDLSSRIDLQQTEGEFFMDSKDSAMLQIADVCAFTSAFFFAMTHSENGIVSGERLTKLVQQPYPLELADLDAACILDDHIIYPNQ